MTTHSKLPHGLGRFVLIPLVVGLAACAAPRDTATPGIETANQPNAASCWNDSANPTLLASATVNTAPEAQIPTMTNLSSKRRLDVILGF
mgnify:CR=1 FL=1